MPSRGSGRPTFSTAVRIGRRLKNWKINPMRLRRMRESSSSEMPWSGQSSMKISPEVGWSRPPMRFSKVLLPEPLCPIIERNSPYLMRKENVSQGVNLPRSLLIRFSGIHYLDHGSPPCSLLTLQIPSSLDLRRARCQPLDIRFGVK